MGFDSRRLYFVLIGILVLLGLGLILSVRQANSLLEGKSRDLVGLKAQSLATADQQAQLDQDRSDIKKYTTLNTIAESVVPQDKDQAEAVREIVNLAVASGIPKLSSIAFPPSTLGGANTNKGITQVAPVKGVPGVYNLQITVSQSSTSAVPYGDFISFLAALEQNRRTAEVASINVQPEDSNPGLVSFTLVIDEFIRP